MDGNNRIRGKRRGITTHLLTLGSTVGLCLLLLPACSPKIIEKVRTEYVYQTVHQHDTTIVRDSVYVREWLKGDTVYVEKYKDRFVYRDRWRDSIQLVEKHDTTTVEKLVEKNISWAQKAKIGAFPWLVLAVIGALLWIFRKYLF